MPTLTEPLGAAWWTSAILTVGLGIDTFELLVARLKLQSIQPWPVLKSGFRSRAASIVGGLPDALGIADSVTSLLLLRIGPLVGMLLFHSRLALFVLGLTLTVGLLAFRARNKWTLDGADYMYLVSAVGLTAFYAATSNTTQKLALDFIALQALFGYFVSGIQKLASAAWRDGSALKGILGTRLWGSEFFFWAASAPAVRVLASYAVVSYEVFGPFAILVDPVATLTFLGIGLLFHIVNAFAMGLNDFLWAFFATYPSIVVLSNSLQALRHG